MHILDEILILSFYKQQWNFTLISFASVIILCNVVCRIYIQCVIRQSFLIQIHISIAGLHFMRLPGGRLDSFIL